MKDNVIEIEWNYYMEKLIPTNASHVQVEETKKAFYAGAQVMFIKILQAADIEDDDLAQTCINQLDDCLKEHFDMYRELALKGIRT